MMIYLFYRYRRLFWVIYWFMTLGVFGHSWNNYCNFDGLQYYSSKMNRMVDRDITDNAVCSTAVAVVWPILFPLKAAVYVFSKDMNLPKLEWK